MQTLITILTVFFWINVSLFYGLLLYSLIKTNNK